VTDADDAELKREREIRSLLAAEVAMLRERTEEAEARVLRRDREIERLVAQLGRATGRIEELAGEVADETYWKEYASWQLESVRASRWHRLGEALGTRRPGAVRKALKGRARPKVPHRADIPVKPPLGPADTALIDVPAVPLPEGPIVRPDLTVAVIADTFTTLALRYEWRQINDFGPDDWRDVLAVDRPHLLFVESAWNGNGDRWARHVNGSTAPSRQLRELVAWCREQGIPSVLWNKEDPPNFEYFVESARLFDWIFTVDADCVPRYREELGHDRVRVLQFGAQPRIHNPVRIPEQGRYDVAFAGTYYTEKHAGRREQMETVVTPALKYGVHVYSRVDHTDARFAFPAAYVPHIVGTLPYDRMLAAQKLYKVVLNVNTVTGSPTMCARRAFELSAAAIPVLSGPGRAITETFGDLIPVSSSPKQTSGLLQALLNSPELRDRQAHLAMRTVLTRHTYSHRVDTVLETVGIAAERPRHSISVVMPTNRPGRIDQAVAQVARQTWRPLQLVLVLHGLDLDPEQVAGKARAAGLDDVVVLTAGKDLSLGEVLNLGLAAADGDHIAKMDDDDLYGPHYLSDLMLAFGYTEAQVVGKLAHYLHLASTGATVLRFPQHEHRYVDFVRGAAMLVRGDLLRAYRFEDRSRGEDTRLFRALKADGVKVYSADRYSFVVNRSADPGDHTWQISEAEQLREARVAFYGPPEDHALI
jgi:spore maturation protein CgeB